MSVFLLLLFFLYSNTKHFVDVVFFYVNSVFVISYLSVAKTAQYKFIGDLFYS